MLRTLLIQLVLLFPVGAQAGVVSLEESDALVALYDATDGNNWTNNDNWLDFKSGICTWFGVTCNIEQDAVLDIDLSNNNLQGALPAKLGDLSNLQTLNLASNPGITGQIPAELGNLSELTLLLLANGAVRGNLNGPIPSTLGQLSKLSRLRLAGNQLSGNIPVELGNASNLQFISLEANELTGPIPSSLAGLRQLDDLRLFNNQLSGTIPAELGGLNALRLLLLGNNQLAGNIPPELGNLTNLTLLRIDSNQLEGPIPPQLAQLTQLDSSANSLALNFNKLFLADPPDPGLVAFLNTKAPNWDGTQTVAPSNVIATRNGVNIDVSWTLITYTGDNGGYEVLSSTTSGGPYTQVGSTGDKINTSMLSVPASGSGVNFIVVRTRTDPHNFNQSTLTSGFSAEAMAEAAMEFTDRGALLALYSATDGDNWTDNTNWLGDPGTECSWFGVTCNKAEDAVIALQLLDNNLQGTLTFQLGELSQLEELRLSGNRGLSGPIPMAIGNLSKLRILDLAANSLGGLVPKNAKGLSDSSSIPAELGKLSALQFLFLEDNQLAGVIPPELGDLANLFFCISKATA